MSDNKQSQNQQTTIQQHPNKQTNKQQPINLNKHQK